MNWFVVNSSKVRVSRLRLLVIPSVAGVWDVDWFAGVVGVSSVVTISVCIGVVDWLIVVGDSWVVTISVRIGASDWLIVVGASSVIGCWLPSPVGVSISIVTSFKVVAWPLPISTTEVVDEVDRELLVVVVDVRRLVVDVSVVVVVDGGWWRVTVGGTLVGDGSCIGRVVKLPDCCGASVVVVPG